MDFQLGNKYWVPVETSDGIRFQQVVKMIWMANPYPKEINKEFPKKVSTKELMLEKISNQFLKDFQSTSKGMFSKKGFIQLSFSNGSILHLEPKGADFLDMDIQFDKMGITYYPKSYEDVSANTQQGIDRLTMQGVIYAKLFQAVEIQNINLLCSDDRLTNPIAVNSIRIKGKIYFSKMSHFVHDHDDSFTLNIYPDRMYELLTKGSNSLNTRMEIQVSIV